MEQTQCYEYKSNQTPSLTVRTYRTPQGQPYMLPFLESLYSIETLLLPSFAPPQNLISTPFYHLALPLGAPLPTLTSLLRRQELSSRSGHPWNALQRADLSRNMMWPRSPLLWLIVSGWELPTRQNLQWFPGWQEQCYWTPNLSPTDGPQTLFLNGCSDRGPTCGT